MKCPHCLDSFFEIWKTYVIGEDTDFKWHLDSCNCPSCKRVIVNLWCQPKSPINNRRSDYMVWPKITARAQLPAEVPEKFSKDYREACSVLADSTKASAALSRRCLQNLLRERAGIKHSNLSNEIEEAMKSLPTYLAESIDAVRNIGNFAAHPTKSNKTGEIIDVEPGEAEWLLDVLEGLFDFYFVQPEIIKAKRKALDAKLEEAGKPEMK